MCAILVFSGCAPDTRKDKSDKLNIVTTIFPAYDLARSIGNDNVEVTMLISPGNEVHTFEPTPQDIIKISNCDLFIFNGGESDEWVKTVLDGLDKEINMFDFMSVVENNDEHIHDEHVWTSPKNVMKLAETLYEKFCEIDGNNKEYYEENKNLYISELEKLDEEFSNIVQNSKRQELIFADRFPLIHFAKCYDLDYSSVYPGCAEDTEPSAAAISSMIDKVEKENISVVLKKELSNDNIAKTISESTGAKIKVFHTCHNLSTEEFESGATYLSLMKNNAEVLWEALN